jgi:hypothetical protein
MDLAFLTRDDILLLLKEESTDALILGLFSVPEKNIVIRCRLPFPDPPVRAYILSGRQLSMGAIVQRLEPR